MKANKKVKTLIPAFQIDMGGIPIKQALPTTKVDQVDPFLLVHHGKLKYRKHGKAIHQGIGPHPHRGFSPVTFIINGEIHHRDSRGNNQIAKKGEVQWMHAGSGIIHSERPSQALVDQNEYNEFIQLWINSPALKKMQQPNYQYIPENEIPKFFSEDKQIVSKVVAGSYGDQNGKIRTESELLILWSIAKGPGMETFSLPHGYNAMLYTVHGELNIKGYGKMEKECLAIFENDGEQLSITTSGKAEFLILCGLPLNEKVVQQGPFVMNSETQILEAMRDYQMGKMGVLIED
ncbi:pirin family protein [Maribacter polysaccharolyticus]|uniref:pirin family protein n=1 Tax=Maribacter polysaccharolyticus TaxID=3020831 RepID=UPI00237F4435|nr:pirin family protein [Maribacter polysaccharolyticus]MDE3740599.1 pirin family protein [Maribacter polysaccharolyticus]